MLGYGTKYAHLFRDWARVCRTQQSPDTEPEGASRYVRLSAAVLLAAIGGTATLLSVMQAAPSRAWDDRVHAAIAAAFSLL